MKLETILYAIKFSLCALALSYLHGATYPVGNANELQAVLATAVSGDIIELEDGNYGELTLNNRAYTDYLTIQSRNELGAELENVIVDNCAYIRFDNIRVTRGRGIYIRNGSHHIEVLNSETYGQNQYDRANPDYTQVNQLYGLQVENAADIRIENVYVHDIASSGFLFSGVNGLVLRGCNADWMAADGYKFAGVSNALIENNTGMVNVYSSPTAHRDFMQIQSSALSNVVFRGNWAIMTTASFQGIFGKDNISNNNVIIENNIIYGGMARAISVYGTDIVMRNNTAINPTDGNGNYTSTKAAGISGATTSQNNVNATYLAASGISGSNHALQYEDTSRDFYYDDYYVGVSKPVGSVTIEDFRPVPGSPADGQVGAFARINEILNNEIIPRVEAPTITPNGGTFGGPFSSSVAVTLTSATPDADIRYTLDGSTPTEMDPLYLGVLSVNSTATLKAVAFKTDFRPSLVSQATFTIDDIGPQLSSINALGDGRSLQVVFDENPDATRAELLKTYLISDGINVTAASLNGSTVTLTTAQMTDGTTYTLTVNEITDTFGNVTWSQSSDFTFEEVDINTGLLAHWRLDEASGTTAADSSGNNYTGMVNGGATWTSGQIGGALQLDGSNDYIDVNPVPLNGNAMTIALWLIADDFGTADARLISQADGTTDSAHNYMLSTVASGGTKLRCRLKVNNTTTTLVADSVNLQTGEWMHAAAVYDGAALTLYLDGQNVASTPLTGTITSNSTLNTHIGSNSPTSKFFDGAIDDVRMYNRALPANEIQALMLASGTPPDDPVDDTTPPVISSLQVSNITATTAQVSWTTDEPATAQVEYGLSNAYGQTSTQTSQLATSHSVELSGLNAETTYHFRVSNADVSSNNAVSNDQTFTTAEASNTGGATYLVANTSELQAALSSVTDGDTILLQSGSYGTLELSNRNNSIHITIAAAQDAVPLFTSIDISNSSYWIFNGLHVKPRYTSGADGNTAVRLSGSYLVFENSHIDYADSIAAWTASDWLARAGNGLSMGGNNITVRDNTITNVDHAINTGATDSLIARNTITNIRGDGIRSLGDRMVVEYNYIADCYDVDDNHDDGFQSWSNGSGGVGTGTVNDVTLRGNTIINYTDPNRSLRGSMQGIGLFDGTFVNWTIENNLVVVDHWHGISIYGVRDSRIINNTVVDINDTTPGPPWIRVGNHKNGTPPSNCIARNNLATAYQIASTGVIAENNLSIDMDNLNEHFVDAGAGDYRLHATSPAIDAGSAIDAPPTDLAGNARPQGSGYDVGAYEFIQSGPVDATPPTCTLMAPLNDSTISELVTLSATATDNIAVAQVQFLLNGNAIGLGSTLDGTTYNLSWNSFTAANGNYSLQAIAYDSAGNQGVSQLISITTDNPLPDLSDGLLAYWDFNDNNGSTAADLSGNNNDAIIQGAMWTADAQEGSALDLDGTDDYVDAGRLDITGNAMTIALWMKSDDLVNGNLPHRDARLISKATGTGEQDHYWMVSTYAGGLGTTLRFRLKTDGTTSTLIADNGNLVNNQWYYIAAVYDGSQMRLYQDGVEIGQLAKSGNLSTDSTVAAWIGRNPDGARPFDGRIDDVSIYNRALSASDILALANGTGLGGSGETYDNFQTAYDIGAPNEDDDGDQLPNLFEYFAGLDPTEPNSMNTVLWMEADAATASFNFMSPVNGSADLVVEIQKSTDMTTWETIATRNGNDPWPTNAGLTMTPMDAGMEQVQVSESMDNNSRSFYRLRLQEMGQ